MTAALTLSMILMVSLAIVRAAGVALRLTGMPQQAARFQAISALTGTGFTTTEAEITMHHPIRRRILIMLMFTGHLGVVSLASTVILGVSSADGGSNITLQILALITALVAVVILATSARLDLVMCGAMASLLVKLGWLEDPGYEILYEHANGEQLTEHVFGGGTQPSLYKGSVRILALNGAPIDVVNMESLPKLQNGHRILSFGLAADQRNFAQIIDKSDD